jgi:hypothetical protein
MFLPAAVVANLRYGFATNSSSTHSIVYKARQLESVGGRDMMEFGWEHFCLTTAEEKADYFRAALFLYYDGQKKLTTEDAKALALKHFPGRFPTPDANGWLAVGIDHQSCPIFPEPMLANHEMSELWGWIMEAIVLNPDVAIIGGNDNEYDHGRPDWVLGHEDVKVPWVLNRRKADIIFKRDPTGHFITMFNRKTGTKVRTVTPIGQPPTYGVLPDLVDIKITDRCYNECQFCYQGSTPEGRHAAFGELQTLIYNLKHMGVFEVALGGGEPVEHPDIVRILKAVRSEGIIPNFSTRSSMLWSDDILAVVKETCGAVAYSTNNADAAISWLASARKSGIPNPTIHYILGLDPLDAFREFMTIMNAQRALYPTVILLAWKSTGRAFGMPQHPMAGWTDVVRDLATDGNRRVTVGVDSFLATDVAEYLGDIISSKLYEAGDGKFSFYVDAVTKAAAAHSAVTGTDLIGVNEWRELDEVWDRIRRNPPVLASDERSESDRGSED